MIALCHQNEDVEDTFYVCEVMITHVCPCSHHLCQKLFPGINFRTLAATFVFYVPLYRDLMLLGGATCHSSYCIVSHHMAARCG